MSCPATGGSEPGSRVGSGDDKETALDNTESRHACWS